MLEAQLKERAVEIGPKSAPPIRAEQHAFLHVTGPLCNRDCPRLVYDSTLLVHLEVLKGRMKMKKLEI